MPYGYIGKSRKPAGGKGATSGLYNLDDVVQAKKDGMWPRPYVFRSKAIVPTTSLFSAYSSTQTMRVYPQPNGSIIITVSSTNTFVYSKNGVVIGGLVGGVHGVWAPDGNSFYMHDNTYIYAFHLNSSTGFLEQKNTISTGYGFGLGGPHYDVVPITISADGLHVCFGRVVCSRDKSTGSLTVVRTYGNSPFGDGDFYGNGNQFNISMSPDKTRLFTYGNKGSANYGAASLWSLSNFVEQGTVWSRVDGGTSWYYRSPVWTPDSKYVCYHYYKHDDSAQPTHYLHVVSKAGVFRSFSYVQTSVSNFRSGPVAVTDTEIILATDNAGMIAYKYSDDSFTTRTFTMPDGSTGYSSLYGTSLGETIFGLGQHNGPSPITNAKVAVYNGLANNPANV